MTAVPDESARCGCGRATFLVPGYDGARTCSKCGYLTSFCRCKSEDPGQPRSGFRLPSVSDRARAVLGVGMLTAMSAPFVMTLTTSPFMAVFGLGIPLALSGSFFAQWLRQLRWAGAQEPKKLSPASRQIWQANNR